MSASDMVSITMLPHTISLGYRRSPIVSPLVLAGGPRAWGWPSSAATGQHKFQGIDEYKKLQGLGNGHAVLQC